MSSNAQDYLYSLRKGKIPDPRLACLVTNFRGIDLLPQLYAYGNSFCRVPHPEERYIALYNLGFICNQLRDRCDVIQYPAVYHAIGRLLTQVSSYVRQYERFLIEEYLPKHPDINIRILYNQRSFFITPFELFRCIVNNQRPVILLDCRRSRSPQIVHYNLIQTCHAEPGLLREYGKTPEDVLRLFGLCPGNIFDGTHQAHRHVIVNDELIRRDFSLENPNSDCRWLLEMLSGPPFHLNLLILEGGVREMEQWFPMNVKYLEEEDNEIGRRLRILEASRSQDQGEAWDGCAQTSHEFSQLRINEKRPAKFPFEILMEKRARTSMREKPKNKLDKEMGKDKENEEGHSHMRCRTTSISSEEEISIPTSTLVRPIAECLGLSSKPPEKKASDGFSEINNVEKIPRNDEENTKKVTVAENENESEDGPKNDDVNEKEVTEVVKDEITHPEDPFSEKERGDNSVDNNNNTNCFRAEEETKVMKPEGPSFIEQISSDNISLLDVYRLILEEFKSLSVIGPEEPGFTGFFNIGNTCFMNATLHALLSCSHLAYFFSDTSFIHCVNSDNPNGTKGRLSACFKALEDVYWGGEFKTISIWPFYIIFRQYCPQLCNRRQHDAAEFLTFLLDLLHEDLLKESEKKEVEQNYDTKEIWENWNHYKENNARRRESPINSIFKFVTSIYFQCEECGNVKLTFEEDNQIRLDLPSKSLCRLSDCLKKYFESSESDSSIKRECSCCGKPQRCQRLEKLWILPPVLIIILKRFEVKNYESLKKNTATVEFDMDHLDMANYIHEQADYETSMYQLQAITEHNGTLTSGHYVTYVRYTREQWIKYDDEKCFRVKEWIPRRCNAYVLYYVSQPEEKRMDNNGSVS
ncbi:unnamed protein product [Bursaphelenchus xylophilus]|uniref:ubiquitinyl hydrolase 1 n=1 Tax=Bursaphelenchus xylophilus TaxID=6326 RepID=A0A1I7RT66_BURXY|nr:unnamed protein product [Bursaphelenchus xylophilus]CAG9122576.1 unnamed protein product [Bursaphelenchus xylophilus]